MSRDMWGIAEQMDKDEGDRIRAEARMDWVERGMEPPSALAVECDPDEELEGLEEFLWSEARADIKARMLAGERASVAMEREFSYFRGLVEAVKWEVFREGQEDNGIQ